MRFNYLLCFFKNRILIIHSNYFLIWSANKIDVALLISYYLYGVYLISMDLRASNLYPLLILAELRVYSSSLITASWK